MVLEGPTLSVSYDTVAAPEPGSGSPTTTTDPASGKITLLQVRMGFFLVFFGSLDEIVVMVIFIVMEGRVRGKRGDEEGCGTAGWRPLSARRLLDRSVRAGQPPFAVTVLLIVTILAATHAATNGCR